MYKINPMLQNCVKKVDFVVYLSENNSVLLESVLKKLDSRDFFTFFNINLTFLTNLKNLWYNFVVPLLIIRKIKSITIEKNI